LQGEQTNLFDTVARCKLTWRANTLQIGDILLQVMAFPFASNLK